MELFIQKIFARSARIILRFPFLHSLLRCIIVFTTFCEISIVFVPIVSNFSLNFFCTYLHEDDATLLVIDVWLFNVLLLHGRNNRRGLSTRNLRFVKTFKIPFCIQLKNIESFYISFIHKATSFGRYIVHFQAKKVLLFQLFLLLF